MTPIGRTLVLLVVSGACAGPHSRAATLDRPDQERVVEIVARGTAFDAPDRIPSGWTTFRFRNESPFVHFALVERMPPGQGVESEQAEVAPVFQQGLELLVAGRVDAALARFGELPAWFGQVTVLGGPGLTSPGHTSQATVYLDPGTYLLECYVKTDGAFHSYNPDPARRGMVHEFTVTDASSETREPRANLSIDISSGGGIRLAGPPAVGRQRVAVHFADQKTYENFVGHDVHVVRLSDDADLGRLERWMDWRQADGLQTPAPAEFVGGLNEMPSGATGYFTVSFEPGRYALIAEVPGSAEKGMLEPFRIPSSTD